MAEARWNIWIHLVQSLLKHGHQSRVPSHPVQVAFEYLQGWSFHNLCSLYSITSTAQKCIPAFRENLLCCSLCPLLHALALIIIKKRRGPFSLHSPLSIIYIDEVFLEPSHFQAEESQPSQSLLIGKVLQFLHLLITLFWTPYNMSMFWGAQK